jgi:hypothetical protein
MMRFACPNCLSKLSAPDGSEGSETQCPKCGTRLRIPGGTPAPAGYQGEPAPDLPLERIHGEDRGYLDVPLERAEERVRREARRSVRARDEERDDRRSRDRRYEDEDEDGDDRPRRRRGRYECRFCGSREESVTKQRISAGGWVTFAVLILFCWPLCWIGLLIKEDYQACYDCGKPL